MPQHLTLRRAVAADAAAMARIAQGAYQPYVGLMGQPPAPMGADYTAHIARDICFVAEAESQIIAFAVLIEKADGWWLETIATDPAQQGNGAGAALIAMCEQFLTSRTDRYFLYTNEVMTAPYGWYIRLGFVETHRATQDGFARVFMQKTLAGSAEAGEHSQVNTPR